MFPITAIQNLIKKEYFIGVFFGITLLFFTLLLPLQQTFAGNQCGVAIDPVTIQAVSGSTSYPTPSSVSGVDWVRVEFKSCTKDNTGEGFKKSLEDYKSIVDGYRNNGTSVLLIIDYLSFPNAAMNVDGFSQRAGLIAESLGSSKIAYEIWNEPDLSTVGNLDAASYAALLNSAASAIKSKSGGTVITAGLASGDPNYLASLRSAMEGLGGWGNVDGVAVHPYGKAPSACSQYSSSGDLGEFVENFSGVGGKPLWITEIGIDTADQSIEDDYLRCVFDYYKNNRDKIAATLWFAWSDSMVPPFGLLEKNGVEKPALGSFFTTGCGTAVPGSLQFNDPILWQADPGEGCAPPGGGGIIKVPRKIYGKVVSAKLGPDLNTGIHNATVCVYQGPSTAENRAMVVGETIPGFENHAGTDGNGYFKVDTNWIDGESWYDNNFVAFFCGHQYMDGYVIPVKDKNFSFDPDVCQPLKDGKKNPRYDENAVCAGYERIDCDIELPKPVNFPPVIPTYPTWAEPCPPELVYVDRNSKLDCGGSGVVRGAPGVAVRQMGEISAVFKDTSEQGGNPDLVPQNSPILYTSWIGTGRADIRRFSEAFYNAAAQVTWFLIGNAFPRTNPYTYNEKSAYQNDCEVIKACNSPFGTPKYPDRNPQLCWGTGVALGIPFGPMVDEYLASNPNQPVCSESGIGKIRLGDIKPPKGWTYLLDKRDPGSFPDCNPGELDSTGQLCKYKLGSDYFPYNYAFGTYKGAGKTEISYEIIGDSPQAKAGRRQDKFNLVPPVGDAPNTFTDVIDGGYFGGMTQGIALFPKGTINNNSKGAEAVTTLYDDTPPIAAVALPFDGGKKIQAKLIQGNYYRIGVQYADCTVSMLDGHHMEPLNERNVFSHDDFAANIHILGPRPSQQDTTPIRFMDASYGTTYNAFQIFSDFFARFSRAWGCIWHYDAGTCEPDPTGWKPGGDCVNTTRVRCEIGTPDCEKVCDPKNCDTAGISPCECHGERETNSYGCDGVAQKTIQYKVAFNGATGNSGPTSKEADKGYAQQYMESMFAHMFTLPLSEGNVLMEQLGFGDSQVAINEGDAGPDEPLRYGLVAPHGIEPQDAITKMMLAVSIPKFEKDNPKPADEPDPYTGPGAGSSSFAQLLPNPIPTTTAEARNTFTSYIYPRITTNMAVYVEAERQTGVPREVLAGIHYVEADNNPNGSLTSGRTIGTPEPDAGGRVFTSLLENAVYEGFHLQKKVEGGITSWENLITGLSRYNGGGNSNCAEIKNHTPPCPSTPYTGCPPLFFGEDDIYPVNWLDEKHSTMYKRFCADLTCCDVPQIWSRLGVVTVAINLYMQSTPGTPQTPQ